MNGSVNVIGTFSLNGSYDRSEHFYGTTQSTLRAARRASRSSAPTSPCSIADLLLDERRSRRTCWPSAGRRPPRSIRASSRFDIFPRIRFPFTKWQFLTIPPAPRSARLLTEQRTTKTGLNLEDPINRNYYDLAVQITGPVFSRIFNHPGSRLRREAQALDRAFPQHRAHLAHRRLQQFVQLDGTDTIVGRSTRLSYGITNRFFRASRAAAADPRSC
jgi:hypothetical protein